MNKQDILKKALDDEERYLFSHIFDLYFKSEKTNCPLNSFFLTPLEVRRVQECFSGFADITFFGGYHEAERKMAVLGYSEDEYSYNPVSMIKVVSKSKDSLNHRDYLGAVLSLGLQRHKIGDIVIFDNYAVIMCMDDIADYLIYNMTKIKNNNVVCSLYEEPLVLNDEERYKEIDATVASLRLDCVVAAFGKKSRTQAVELIREKRVFLNYMQTDSVSCDVSDGDVLSVRGIGKARIHTDGYLTKKGRIHIKIKYYI